jgi:hypothetical protein
MKSLLLFWLGLVALLAAALGSAALAIVPPYRTEVQIVSGTAAVVAILAWSCRPGSRLVCGAVQVIGFMAVTAIMAVVAEAAAT